MHSFCNSSQKIRTRTVQASATSSIWAPQNLIKRSRECFSKASCRRNIHWTTLKVSSWTRGNRRVCHQQVGYVSHGVSTFSAPFSLSIFTWSSWSFSLSFGWISLGQLRGVLREDYQERTTKRGVLREECFPPEKWPGQSKKWHFYEFANRFVMHRLQIAGHDKRLLANLPRKSRGFRCKLVQTGEREWDFNLKLLLSSLEFWVFQTETEGAERVKRNRLI